MCELQLLTNTTLYNIKLNSNKLISPPCVACVCVYVCVGASVGLYHPDEQLFVARILCVVVGGFFIVVFLYWFLLLMWYMFLRDSHFCDFSCLALVWWLLSFVFSGLFFSLLTETLDSSRKLKLKAYFQYECMTVNNTQGPCFLFVVPYGLILMSLFQLVYFILFLKILVSKCK